ncbi:MAG: YIP1 family protein [Anaerolineae bacterium]|nr:YIP1 family protein [Anaerolineae bacterium]
MRRFDISRFVSLLLHPRRAFTTMAAEGSASWSAPMLVLTAMAILAVVVGGYFKTHAAMMGEVQLPPDWQYWTPEMQENFMQAQQATQGAAFVYVIPMFGSLIGLWLGWLILAGLLHLGSTLLGGRGSMQNALTVVAWASLPFAVRDILRVVFMLIAGHAIASPGLSGFVANSGFLSQVLARTDIFLVWSIVLLVIGFAIVDGLPRGKAFANVMVVILLVLLAQAGVSSLTSSLGGSAVQRPFF